MKSQGEIEAAICEGMTRFEQEYMGRGPKDIHAHLIGDLLVVRVRVHSVRSFPESPAKRPDACRARMDAGGGGIDAGQLRTMSAQLGFPSPRDDANERQGLRRGAPAALEGRVYGRSWSSRQEPLRSPAIRSSISSSLSAVRDSACATRWRIQATAAYTSSTRPKTRARQSRSSSGMNRAISRNSQPSSPTYTMPTPAAHTRDMCWLTTPLQEPWKRMPAMASRANAVTNKKARREVLPRHPVQAPR